MADLEIKKMKQGMSYSCKEKTIILNVFKYFRNQFPDKCVTDVVRRTAKATGCSEKSVFQFRKEEASVEGFKEPSKTKIRKNININSRDIKYDNTVRQAIRNIIYDLQYKNIVPSLNTILKNVNNDKSLPNFSLMTLRRLMFDMGFSYQKNGNKSVLVEKPDNRFVIISNSEQNIIKTQQNHILPPQPIIQPQTQENIHLNHINKLSEQRILDTRLVPPPPLMHKPIQMAPVHQHPMMSHNDHTNMIHANHQLIHKAMPNMMMHHRDMVGPPPPIGNGSIGPPMDIHRKRDPMQTWMHGMIKGQ